MQFFILTVLLYLLLWERSGHAYYSVLGLFKNNMGVEANWVFSWWCRCRIDVPKNNGSSCDYFSPVINFLASSISIILIPFIGKKLFSFEPCATKLVIIKYMLKGCLHKFLENIKTISPLFLMIIPPILIYIKGVLNVNTQWVILVDFPFKRGGYLMYLFSFMCWVCN